MSELFSKEQQELFPHPKVRRQVIEYLLQQIMSQTLQVGSVLPSSSELCEQLAVSRTAVRDAIAVLAAKGMLAAKSGEGTTVQPFSSWRLLDPEVLGWLRESELALGIIEHLLEIRLIIEPEAAALAAIRGSMAQFLAMAEALARMGAGSRLRSPESTQGDIDFHNIILAASGNIFLARMRDLCMVSVELIVRLTFEKVESVQPSLENHQALLEAIRSRDPELARMESRHVLCKTMQDLEGLNIPFRRDLLQHFATLEKAYQPVE